MNDQPRTGFLVTLPVFNGTLGELAHALRTATLRAEDVDVLELVKHYIKYFHELVDENIHLASEALPLLARVIELKTRFLLPRPPKETAEDEEFLEETLEAITLLEELEDAILFLKNRREERRVVLPAKTPRPSYPRPERPLKIGLGKLAEMASKYAVSNYFELAVERLTMASAMKQLLQNLKRLRKALFREVIQHKTWTVAAISFAGMLELYKEKKLALSQDEAYGPIEIELIEAKSKKEAA